MKSTFFCFYMVIAGHGSNYSAVGCDCRTLPSSCQISGICECADSRYTEERQSAKEPLHHRATYDDAARTGREGQLAHLVVSGGLEL